MLAFFQFVCYHFCLAGFCCEIIFFVLFQLFGLESGKTEIHTVTQALREPEQLELEYLNNYLSRF